jgi:hypothetical protein
MEERIMLGGFFYENIKNWIIKECLESGDPENFFYNIYDIVNEIYDSGDYLHLFSKDLGEEND